MSRICVLMLYLGLLAGLALSREARAEPPNVAISSTETDRMFLAEVAEQVRKARAEATEHEPPNTKMFSGADQLAIHLWVERASPDTRAKLASALVQASTEQAPLDQNLRDLSGSLLRLVLEDRREDLAVQMFASPLGIGWWCPEFVMLQLWYLKGKTEAGVELLLDAYDKASPARQDEIERTVRRSVGAYLPRGEAAPTGAALIRWTRDWYTARKARLLPNDQYCGDNDCDWAEPVLVDIDTFLESRLTLRSKFVAQGSLRLELTKAETDLPGCVTGELTEKRGSYPHKLEQLLQAEHAVPRIVAIRSVDRCDTDWLLIDSVVQAAEPGQCASQPVDARFLLWLNNSGRLKLLPEQRDK